MSKCIRTARMKAKHVVIAVPREVLLETSIRTEETDTSDVSIATQIRENDLSFEENIIEFKSLLIFENFINEFQILVEKDDINNKVEKIFSKLSKQLNINKNNKLELLDYIKIFTTVEKKVSGSKYSTMILQVSNLNLYLFI